jgi:hypothetical protein
VEQAVRSVRADEVLSARSGPILDEELAENITHSGGDATDEQVAEARRRLGSWLPEPRKRGSRLRPLSQEAVAARGRLIEAATQLRTVLAGAGTARAEAFSAAGYDPQALAVRFGQETTPRGEAAALDTAVWSTHLDRSVDAAPRIGPMPAWPAGRATMAETLRRRVIEIREVQAAVTLGVPAGLGHRPSGPAPEEASSWETILVSVTAAWLAMSKIVTEHLPRPRRIPDRISQTWYGLALDRFYYQENSSDVAQMEEAAWQLVTTLPEGRVPGKAIGLLRAGHRRWIDRWLSTHDDEMDHLKDVADEIKQIHRDHRRTG